MTMIRVMCETLNHNLNPNISNPTLVSNHLTSRLAVFCGTILIPANHY